MRTLKFGIGQSFFCEKWI